MRRPVARVAGFMSLIAPGFLHRGEHAPIGHGLRSPRPEKTLGLLPHGDTHGLRVPADRLP